MLEEDQMIQKLTEAAKPESLLDNLNPNSAIGQIMLLDYDVATLGVHDHHKEKSGGLAKGMFLLSGKTPVEESTNSFVLLRVMGAMALPNQANTDNARLVAMQESIGESLWSDKLTTWVKSEIALAGLETKILGTLFFKEDGCIEFAEDISNYYSAQGSYVWKPTNKLLSGIVNLTHQSNNLNLEQLGVTGSHELKVPVAKTRFSAADKKEYEKGVQVDVSINPIDLLKRRTAFFGMSRSGKSNAMKITAQAIYLLRRDHPEVRVGQLIFDLNGEYAQDNPQDGKGLHRVYELISADRQSEVESYGTFIPTSDPNRKITKINFFGRPIPKKERTNKEFVESALDQLLVGREIIKERLAAETTRFTTAFRDVDLSVPANISDHSVATRYFRSVFVHQVALSQAGLESPDVPDWNGLFSKDLVGALRSEENEKSDHIKKYIRASEILEDEGASWSNLAVAMEALNRFINDKSSAYATFEEDYIARKSKSKEEWADPRLKSMLKIFETPNGVRAFQDVGIQHSVKVSSDFADDIVRDLRAGKLVIFDQSSGDPNLNRRMAERIMWKVFKDQQSLFTKNINHEPWERHVLVYVEEAHNLFPKGGSQDVLSTVWARSVKEGGKMNLGVVFATQAPSSILPEMLSETNNWFISHLNSENETKIVEKYHDFKDFIPQILRISEPGFIRLRTLSSGYTVPVKLNKFEIP